MWRHALVLEVLFALAAVGAAPVWQRVTAGSTELLTAADAAQAQAALAELEALRSVLRAAAPELAAADARLRIVALPAEGGYDEFRLNAFSPAWYAPGPDWGAIVVFGLEERDRPALRHEFIHHLLRAGGRKLPLWLEEGLADALSSLPREEAERRVKMLRGGRRIPWRELFTTRPGAALYQDWESARLFYAQSWALVEALARNAGGMAGFAELGQWRCAEQLPDAEIERWMRPFLRRPRPMGRRWKLEKAPVMASVEPAPAGLVWMVLGRLALQLGRFDAAEARLRQAVLVWPESLVWLGELESRRGRLIEARAAWRRAMERGLADARTLLRLAVLEQDLPDGAMTPVLERLLELDPAQEEARLALVSQYFRQGRWTEAWRRLQEVRNAPPRWAGFYQQALMLARTRLHAGESFGTN